MQGRDLKNAFGYPPASFERRVLNTVENLEEVKMTRKNTYKIALITAIVVALLTGTALAVTGRMGIVDFFESELPEDAVTRIEDLSALPSIQTEHIQYTVKEALADGNKLIVTVDMELLEPDKYILLDGFDCLPVEPVPGSDKTFEQLAAETGKILVGFSNPHVRMVDHISLGGFGVRWDYQGDRITIFSVDEYQDDLPIGALNVVLSVLDYEVTDPINIEYPDGSSSYHPNPKSKGTAEMPFTLNIQEYKGEHLIYDTPVELPLCVIDSVELKQGLAYIDMIITYSEKPGLLKDKSGILSSYDFITVDANGNEMEVASSYGNWLDEKEKSIKSNIKLYSTGEPLPDTLTLVVRNHLDESLSETVVLDLTKAKRVE